jgi:peroxiredoxin
MPCDVILMETVWFRSAAMARTASTMLALGTPLPDFRLARVNGGTFASTDVGQQPVLLMVLCAHCPFVKHIEPEITRLEHDFGDRVQMIGVSSNSLITHPQDGPAQLKEQAQRHGWTFPYLLDDQHALAKSLQAACTPEFYLFSQHSKGSHPTLLYRGQLDSSRPGNDQPLDGSDLRAALNAVLTGTLVSQNQVASVGCNVKWNPGQEPEWFG